MNTGWNTRTMSLSQGRIPACLTCRQKKINCDRRSPSCSRCTKNGLDCLYPATNSRYIVSRERSCKECRRRRIKCDRKRPCSSCAIPGVDCVYVAVERLDNENTMPVIANNAVTSSSPLQRDNSVIVSANTIPAVNRDRLSMYPSLLLGNDLISVNLTQLHPSIANIWLLWHTFSENVEPLFKLFHAPSFHKQLLLAVQDLGSIDGDLETLLFAVYLAAIVVQDEGECLNKFGQSKSELLQK
jgi:Zn(2)-Cys(6) binuclear cluster domain-containing protein